MRQVFYIEADEEIISVVDRLRRSRSEEVTLVFPQGASVLHSVINLKLLDREAKKYGKTIILVTADASGRALAEKIGIPVQSYQHQSEPHGYDDETLESNALAAPEYVAQPEPTAYEPHRDGLSLGSGDFFSPKSAVQAPEPRRIPVMGNQPGMDGFRSEVAQQPAISPQATLSLEPMMTAGKPSGVDGGVRRIPVRDRTPKRLTTLNSTREEASVRQPVYDVPSYGQPNVYTPPQSPAPEQQIPAYRPAPSQSMSDRQQKLAAYFSKNREDASDAVVSPPSPRQSVSSVGRPPRAAGESSGQGRGWWWVVAFVGVMAMLGGGVWAYLYLPHADIALSIKTTKADVDARFEAGTTFLQSADQTRQLSTRLVEIDKEIIRTFDASGEASASDHRSRGTVTISNAYDANAQTLVATTRLLAADGKLFRLKDTVTVPGMKQEGGKTIPGTVSAEVLADQPGAEYDIAPTTFTIPGLGSGKKEKITAASDKAFLGGKTDNTVVTTVTAADIIAAKKETEADIKSEVENALRAELKSGEQFLTDAVELTILSSNASPSAGVAASQFQYDVKIHARALAFPENDVKAMLLDKFVSQQSKKNLTVNPEKIFLEYGQPEAHFDTKVLRFSVHATATIEPVVVADKLKEELLGKGEEDLQQILDQHPEVSNIEVQFGNMPFFSRVPYRPEQVALTIKYDAPVTVK